MTLRPDLVEEGITAYRANALLPGQPAIEVIPVFAPDSDVIVEWRACTVAIIDSLVPDINRALGHAISRKETLISELLEWRLSRSPKSSRQGHGKQDGSWQK